tara:strand:+ start:477 stop:614 length:138 start_codon:yes stop_codon:yes gene_type:complete
MGLYQYLLASHDVDNNFEDIKINNKNSADTYIIDLISEKTLLEHK